MANLTFLAGESALALIRDGGLDEASVKVVAGAAGGPKWLVLSHLDRAIFGEWFKDRAQPLFLLGSSIGAWRFAAVCRKNMRETIDSFEHEYLHQSYQSARPSPEEVTRGSLHIQKTYLSDRGIREVLDHPQFRLNILAVRCKGIAGSRNRYVLGLALLMAIGLNTLSRKYLGLMFERALFSDPRDTPPFFEMNEFPISKTPLTERNLRKALLASGSIPMVMSEVTDIPGAAAGVYRDGGVIDYHLDLPLLPEDGVALFPHYMDRIIPGWFDKRRTSRRPKPEHMKNVLLVAPSAEFVAGLPNGKIPDRDDFIAFQGRDDERRKVWKTVIEQCRALGEEFLETVASGRIRHAVRPLF